jgi:hypothetical protein
MGDYERLANSADGSARVRFTGPWRGHAVRWTVTIQPLADYARAASQSHGRALRQFIEMTPVRDGAAELTIALRVPTVDHPTILKTMVMIRRWKNLRPGRHYFGPAVSFPA